MILNQTEISIYSKYIVYRYSDCRVAGILNELKDKRYTAHNFNNGIFKFCFSQKIVHRCSLIDKFLIGCKRPSNDKTVYLKDGFSSTDVNYEESLSLRIVCIKMLAVNCIRLKQHLKTLQTEYVLKLWELFVFVANPKSYEK